MNRTRSVKVGAFIVVAIILFIAVLIVFANWAFWRERQNYSIRFPYSVSGLSVGSRVELWGVRVGDVHSITIDEDRISVVIRVEKGVRIPQDAEAVLKFEGLTGLKYIDIEGGNLKGPRLALGAEIRPASRGLSEAVDEAVKVVYHLNEVLTQIDDVLGEVSLLVGPGNRERVSQILDDAAKTVASASRVSDDIGVVALAARRKGPALLTSLASAAESAERMASQSMALGADLAATIQDSQNVVRELAALTKNTGAYMQTLLLDIRETASSARSWIRSLEASPSRLFFGGTRKELPPP